MRAIAAVLATALVAATPAAAGRFASAPAGAWATINVCDTAGAPDGVGVRGSMPGSGDRRERMFLRIQLQFLRADGRWKGLGIAGDSGWIALGSARSKAARQGGQTFTVAPPAGGRQAVVLRAVVRYQWRRGVAVARSARLATTAGHAKAEGADPAGFSAATCRLR